MTYAYYLPKTGIIFDKTLVNSTKMKVTIFLMLTLLTHTLADMHEFISLKEDWRVAKCAATLRQNNQITRLQFNKVLDHAKTMGAPYVKYYSAGITTGLETRAVIGKVVDPVFDGSIGFDYKLSNLWYKYQKLDLGLKFDKPVLIWSVNSVDGLDVWDNYFMSSFNTNSCL